MVGATGQIGRAVVESLAGDGWAVTAMHTGRTEAPGTWAGLGVDEGLVDRASTGFDALLGEGADLVVDCIAYDDADGRRLLDHASDLGAVVVVSSASVYADDQGRTLDEATGVHDFPDFGGPVAEDAPTVAAGPATYSSRKRGLEEVLLSDGRLPTTVLRPCAVHGVGSTMPRELWPLLRARARRPRLPLAFDGVSTFHTTSAVNLAELVRIVAACPGTRLVNHGDPDSRPVREIVQLVAATVGHRFELLPFHGPSPGDGVGASPWSVARPLVVDMAAAAALGYRPVTSYASAVVDTCRWTNDRLDAAPGWQDAFAQMAPAYGSHFADTEAEDRWLARRS